MITRSQISQTKTKYIKNENSNKDVMKIKNENIFTNKMQNFDSLLNCVLNRQLRARDSLILGYHLKNDLDTILDNVDKSWAPLKATIACISAKIVFPEWDTRYHQTQIGGMYSLRSIDRTHVANFFHKHQLYSTCTEFALTRSFEKAEPFTQEYSGNISPRECKKAFLNIIEYVNTNKKPFIWQSMLVYLVQHLKKRKKCINDLQKSSWVPTSQSHFTLRDVEKSCDFINELGSGCAVLPVIAVHTLLSIIQPHLWPCLKIKDLKEHTSPDNHCESFGDVEAFMVQTMDMSKPTIKTSTKIAIEIKHKIQITESILTIFDHKTRDHDIPLKYILTTAPQQVKVSEKNNILIDSCKGFILSYLQQALFHDAHICDLFLETLHERIMKYDNVGYGIKKILYDTFDSLTHLKNTKKVKGGAKGKMVKIVLPLKKRVRFNMRKTKFYFD